MAGPLPSGRSSRGMRFSTTSAYSPGMAQEIFPADLPGPVTAECQRLGVAAHRALKLGGYSRVDFRLTPNGELVCLGEHLAGDDGHQPPPAIGQSGRHRLWRAVRADLSRRTQDGGTMSMSAPTRITPWVTRVVAGLLGAYVLLGTIFTAPSIAAALRLDPAIVAAALDSSHLPAGARESAPSPLRRRADSAHRTRGRTPPRQPRVRPLLGLLYRGDRRPRDRPGQPRDRPAHFRWPRARPGDRFARAWFGEDDEVSLEPLPVRLRLRVLAAGLIPVLALPALVWSSSAISLAHLGGLPAAWLFLKLRGSGRRIHAPPQLPMRRPVMAPIRLEVEAATTSAAASPPASVGMRTPSRHIR